MLVVIVQHPVKAWVRKTAFVKAQMLLKQVLVEVKETEEMVKQQLVEIP